MTPPHNPCAIAYRPLPMVQALALVAALLAAVIDRGE